MSKMTAPTKTTGGGGDTFADKVAAGFFAQMLKRKFSLEIDLGVMTELHFETRDIGHVLDDLRLTLKRGPAETRRSVSVKPNRISKVFQRLDDAGNDRKSLKRHQSIVIGPQSDHTLACHRKVLSAAFSGLSY